MKQWFAASVLVLTLITPLKVSAAATPRDVLVLDAGKSTQPAGSMRHAKAPGIVAGRFR